MERIRAFHTTVSHRIGETNVPITDVYVPVDSIGGRAFYTDPNAASDIGLRDLVVRCRKGAITEKDGLNFVENLWRAFSGNSVVFADRASEGTVIAPSRPERNAPRGEPKMDPMEDIEGQFRRFQQRDQEL